MKFATQSQMSRGNYGTYTSVKDVIVQEVQQKYKHGSDMAKLIRDGKLFDIDSVRPTRILSELDKTDERAIKQAGLDILFQEELRAFIDRKMLLNENKCKAYSLIFSSYCTRQMQQRIEEHPAFDLDIIDNPIRLLTEIKTLTHDTVRAEYPIASIVDYLARWINAIQYEHESLNDYVKQSKYNRDIVRNQIGNEILHTFMKTTKEYVGRKKGSD